MMQKFVTCLENGKGAQESQVVWVVLEGLVVALEGELRRLEWLGGRGRGVGAAQDVGGEQQVVTRVAGGGHDDRLAVFLSDFSPHVTASVLF
jgi:hypothetical protein